MQLAQEKHQELYRQELSVKSQLALTLLHKGKKLFQENQTDKAIEAFK